MKFNYQTRCLFCKGILEGMHLPNEQPFQYRCANKCNNKYYYFPNFKFPDLAASVFLHSEKYFSIIWSSSRMAIHLDKPHFSDIDLTAEDPLPNVLDKIKLYLTFA